MAKLKSNPSLDMMLVEIPLDQIYISPTNPRQTYTKLKLEELAADIKTNGLMSPIIVRDNPNTEGVKYEIVVGARRSLAYRINEALSILCFVKVLTDEQVFDMQFSENLKREDVDPLEEAQAFDFYLHSRKLTVNDVAARLNCSPNFIYSRIRLNHLIDDAKNLLKLKRLTLRLADYISKFSEEVQGQIIKSIVHGEGENREVWRTEQAAINHIRDYHLTKLSDAPFDILDSEAIGGACTNCVHNTCYNTMLFSEYANEGRCTNRKCYESKRNTYQRKMIYETKAKSDDAIFLSAQGSYLLNEEDLDVNIQYAYNYEVVDENTEGAIPALCVDQSTSNRDTKFKPLKPIFVLPVVEQKQKNQNTHHNFHVFKKECDKIAADLEANPDLAYDDDHTRGIFENFEGLGESFDYGKFYFSKIHKKHPYKPLNQIVSWKDDYDNIQSGNRQGNIEGKTQEEYVAERLENWYEENKKYDWNLSHDWGLRVHVLEHISEVDLEKSMLERRYGILKEIYRSLKINALHKFESNLVYY